MTLIHIIEESFDQLVFRYNLTDSKQCMISEPSNQLSHRTSKFSSNRHRKLQPFRKTPWISFVANWGDLKESKYIVYPYQRVHNQRKKKSKFFLLWNCHIEISSIFFPLHLIHFLSYIQNLCSYTFIYLSITSFYFWIFHPKSITLFESTNDFCQKSPQ